MVEVSGAFSPAELADFLADQDVPLRLAVHRPDGSQWVVTLWYRYDPDAGVFECATGADAIVVEFLRADPSVGFEVSVNEPPYRGVRGSGEVEILADEDKALLRHLLDRYLDGRDDDLAERLLDPEREEVRLRIHPADLYSWDYTNRMAERRD